MFCVLCFVSCVLPLSAHLRLESTPYPPEVPPMKWITRANVKVDRVACPWLIRHFIDEVPEFFFVPAEEVLTEAERLGALPFEDRKSTRLNSSHGYISYA